eukprot:COSAG06_NODE_72643_length_168_cov_14.608696_1_plen_38_part_01
MNRATVYQDRLGTNIGKAALKSGDDGVLSRSGEDRQVS